MTCGTSRPLDVPATNDAETRSQKGLNRGFAILDLAETLVGGASCQAMAAGVLGPPVVYGLAGMC